MKINTITFSLLFFLSLLPASSAAEKVAWRDCVAEAKRTHPVLLAAEAAVRQARASKGETRGSLLPQIRGSIRAGRSKTAGSEAENSYSYNLSGEQLLFDGLESWYDLDLSEQELIASRLEAELSSAGILLELRESFVDLLEAQEMILIAEEIKKRRVQQLDMVQLRYDGGREHRGSLLTARANLAQAEFDVKSARREIELAQRNLSRRMGRDVFTPITAKGELDTPVHPDSPPDMETLAREHPSVLKQSAQVKAASYRLKAARAGFFPEISASASIGRSGEDWPAETESWSAGLSLSLPIFSGGSRIYEVRYYQANLEETLEEARNTWNDTLYYLRQAWKDQVDSIEDVSVQRRYLEADEERAQISEAQYATGLLSFDNWIIIEDNLVRTRKSYLSSRAAALRSQAEWAYRAGLTVEQELFGETELP